MDQFKPEELKAMEIGGNENARKWMEGEGLDMTLKPQEKYNSDIAQDYKDKLAADIQGVEWVRQKREPKPKAEVTAGKKPVASSSSGGSPMISNRRFGDGHTNTSNSTDPDTKARNETYFSSLGKANESRPDHLPPSQGGKYAGFGNSPQQPHPDSAASVLDNFQNDPIGSLTKGWGIFAKTVTKSVDQVNEAYIKPGVKNFSEGDVGQSTKKAMMQFGQRMQETGKYGMETFNSFTSGNPNRGPGKDSGYSKLFDGLGEEPSFSQQPAVEPAFGLVKPEHHTKLQGIENPSTKKKGAWDHDDWEKF